MPDDMNSPLRLDKFKEIVRRESSGLKKYAESDKGPSAFTLGLVLSSAVKKLFFEKTKTKFTGEPKMVRRLLTVFEGKMRVNGMEKFNVPTVFSVVEFALNEEALKKQEYLLTLVIYLDRVFLPEFLRLMQYSYIDFDDDQEVMDGCGTLVNLIAGQYKRKLAGLGYGDLTMSHFRSYINSAVEGLEIPAGLTEKHEISFDIEGAKGLVVELVAPAFFPK